MVYADVTAYKGSVPVLEAFNDGNSHDRRAQQRRPLLASGD